ncbi:glycerol-3-phosphate acyltransferase 3 isoform X1 [Hydra vulgaris]|uniref:glycerol-3-phosphate acyltransferase 3 isoform X1 n=1 Tax=Hydra vulgaris TaxID=6087 RepID=UPI001F5E35C1|nr:glycerol-3-phosphate acyltransferase 3 [Hydra vulgaris]
MELITFFYLVYYYLMFIFILFIIPASFNISLGFRNLYINSLLKVFEYGRKKQTAKNILNEAASGIIDHESDHELEAPKSPVPSNISYETLSRNFQLADICEFLKSGIEHIIEDEVTKRFDAAELPSWNLLSRTNINYTSVQFISFRLTMIWVLGFLVRYLIFLPVRVTILTIGLGFLLASMSILPLIPNVNLRFWLCKWVTLLSFRIISRGLSIVVNFHNRENMAKGGGICVANHTSPIDAFILGCDRNYALIGQMQSGIMGTVQKSLLKAQDHIFFERSELKDRLLVVNRMREHVEDSRKNPILIFPEGTCINNTSVMMFKKGSFEVGGVIYPVAIKYDAIFGNPFWNSAKESMLLYIVNMVTSWAIVCDVWYLPAAEKLPGEDAVQFANRVKKDIARQGGLVDMSWDGGLKREAVPPKFLQEQQKILANKIN